MKTTPISKSEYLKPHHLNHLNEWNDTSKGMKFNQDLYVKILEEKENKPMKQIKEYRYFIEYTGDPNKVIVSIQQKKTFVFRFGWRFEFDRWLNIESHTINPMITNKYRFIENVLETCYNEKLKRENTVIHPHIFSNVKES